MPGFNRKGPQGDGPMTGRKRGRCINKNTNPSPNEAERQASGNQSFQQDDFLPRRLGLRKGLRRRNAFSGGFGRRS